MSANEELLRERVDQICAQGIANRSLPERTRVRAVVVLGKLVDSLNEYGVTAEYLLWSTELPRIAIATAKSHPYAGREVEQVDPDRLRRPAAKRPSEA